MPPNGGSYKPRAAHGDDPPPPPPGGQGTSTKRLLFMGLKRSGKSSIINVVIYKEAPNETVFIPATIVIKKHLHQSFRNLQLWDLPGQIDFLENNFDTDSIFGAAGAIVWVLDAQDDYLESIARLTDTIVQLQQSYPNIKFSVFIHKVDSLSGDYRDEAIRDIIQRIMDDLNDAGLENPPVSFYPTSVYDDSIYEALSKVMQLLDGQLPTFETLLNTIAASCKMQKLYLFDTKTKLYVASDTSPVDMAGYTLCSDYIDTVVDLNDMYHWNRDAAKDGGGGTAENGNGNGNGNGTGPLHNPDQPTDIESFISGARGCCLYLREVNEFLSLVGFSKEPRFAEGKPLVDYNVQLFQTALAEVLAFK